MIGGARPTPKKPAFGMQMFKLVAILAACGIGGLLLIGWILGAVIDARSKTPMDRCVDKCLDRADAETDGTRAVCMVACDQAIRDLEAKQPSQPKR